MLRNSLRTWYKKAGNEGRERDRGEKRKMKNLECPKDSVTLLEIVTDVIYFLL